MNINAMIDKLMAGLCDNKLFDIYLDEAKVPYQRNRYINALREYEKLFGDAEAQIFSTPGRSEVCGNHTDHQKGKVLATSINLDAIGVACATDDNTIHLKSGDFPMEVIDLADLSINESEFGTTKALIKGVAAGLKERGYKLSGFNAYVTSDVLMGAGLSSSAAFEGLIGTIISGLHNDMKLDSVTNAIVGQYAENVYFGKPCGLMDQMACCVGGMVYIDFEDPKNPIVKPVESDFEKAGLSLCIVDTKCSHADLTDDYAAIPKEMKAVASALGKDVLREVSESEFYGSLPKLKEQVSDRSILRAIHFFEEESRVEEAVSALEKEDYVNFLNVIKASGESSACKLQNIYSPKNPDSQNMTLALALTGKYIGENGVCRVHGGGFAGTIQAFVKNKYVQEYKENIEKVFGEGSCHVLKVRPYGGIKVI